jgi:NTE family protein
VADDRRPETAFVLGGGGVLGSVEVGMLRALTERGVFPDLVVGSSIGALNGALFAADPTVGTVQRLTDLWTDFQADDVFGGSLVSRISNLAKVGTHIHAEDALRRLIEANLPAVLIEDLPVAYQCVAASIERAGPHWFRDGPVVDAVMASCAVPGLFPPVVIEGEHFYDGGLVSSIPVGRAVHLGARTVYVLHVGRIEQALKPPRRPWEVGYVAFEIARRSRFVEDMANLPDGISVHALPSGAPAGALRLRSRNDVPADERIRHAYEATAAYLDAL